MKIAIITIWLFVAYLFITQEARSEYIEINQGDIYEFCLKTDFINMRFCFEYVKECVLDEGVKEMQFCQDDYKAGMWIGENNE